MVIFYSFTGVDDTGCERLINKFPKDRRKLYGKQHARLRPYSRIAFWYLKTQTEKKLERPTSILLSVDRNVIASKSPAPVWKQILHLLQELHQQDESYGEWKNLNLIDEWYWLPWQKFVNNSTLKRYCHYLFPYCREMNFSPAFFSLVLTIFELLIKS